MLDKLCCQKHFWNIGKCPTFPLLTYTKKINKPRTYPDIILNDQLLRSFYEHC